MNDEVYMLALSIISGIVCCAGGLFFGIIPLRENEQTSRQKTLSRTASIVVFGFVIILILLGDNIGSWISIALALVGFGIGRIPPLRRFFSSHWKIFRAKNAKTMSPRKLKKKQQQQKQTQKQAQKR